MQTLVYPLPRSGARRFSHARDHLAHAGIERVTFEFDIRASHADRRDPPRGIEPDHLFRRRTGGRTRYAERLQRLSRFQRADVSRESAEVRVAGKSDGVLDVEAPMPARQPAGAPAGTSARGK